MDYRETIDYLYSRLPVFHKIGLPAYRPDLRNINTLCQRLENPQNRFRSVHIGGTNGKGSVSHMLAAILQTAGYKTGLYTSPHLVDFRERIRVNGCMIPEEDVVRFVAANRSGIEGISPSFFEVTVAMAFWYFALQEVDIAVVEVGMGGRLDSTNIITPELSVITNIGLDHVHVLGSTLDAIAGEKAGIIKFGVPVVIGEYQEETAPVFREKAAQMQAPVHFASLDWDVNSINREEGFLEIAVRSSTFGKTLDLQLDLTGGYQKKNIRTVLSAVEELKKRGFTVGDKIVRDAVRRVKALTGFAGRWQILSAAPLMVCDTGHNQDGIREVLQQISATPHEKLHIVFGMVNDKDVEKILTILPQKACYYFCKAGVPRAMDENVLQEKAFAAGLRGEAFTSVKEAVEAARQAASVLDMIFIGGSTFVVAEAIVAANTL
ncbi:dihydrofolate synthase/folylpolyglutamate synthase [Anseongella ginsenosidimutans]|uniref:Dihydrofolate synthase/folylpolyglutamate synthase n=1 Tax=Anseongella ginsenosidimutans TaxID=496056 RepID=A0A4R3KNC9_9SPHI|nr:folylpolyglutamate synthase/dihydrofolate synthase family protein [Anseongella ginsenosidimutans]QEC52727.1 bifunctional folylpolyglutamate synthase/dihydrofolate synthase [Anseongella ginsenosidimutans]TCS85480.1 dihydrofolate synthase/folylpolyglutamate synthase [Anseongella ginsenosidimutans]